MFKFYSEFHGRQADSHPGFCVVLLPHHKRADRTARFRKRIAKGLKIQDQLLQHFAFSQKRMDRDGFRRQSHNSRKVAPRLASRSGFLCGTSHVFTFPLQLSTLRRGSDLLGGNAHFQDNGGSGGVRAPLSRISI